MKQRTEETAMNEFTLVFVTIVLSLVVMILTAVRELITALSKWRKENRDQQHQVDEWKRELENIKQSRNEHI